MTTSRSAALPASAATDEPPDRDGDIDVEAAPAQAQTPAPVPVHLQKETPLPWRQLGVLILMRFAEPICFTQCFPYINRMMLDIGAADSPAEVGFYGGLVESLFALTQLCTVLSWGQLSDRIGRKPVMLIGLTGTTISQLSFGFSQNFAWAVVARCFAGATNGNVAIIKSIVGEITDRTNQARAFSFLPLCWAVGCTLGPLIGGYLSHPEEQYPGLFGEGGALWLGGLWLRYPYLLPCLVSASTTTFSIVLGFFFLEETLPSKVEEKKRRQAARRAVEQQQQRPDDADDDASTRPLLGSPAPSFPSSYGATSGRSVQAAVSSSSSSSAAAAQGGAPAAPANGHAAQAHAHTLPHAAAFARERRGRSRARVGQVQSWFSGFTPSASRDVSRDVSRAPSPGPHERNLAASPTLATVPSEEAQANEHGRAAAAQPPARSAGKSNNDGGVLSILRVRHIQKVLLSYAFLALCSVSIDAVLVLFLYEPIALGGLSFTSQQTGTLLSISGFGSVFVQLLLFPFLQKRVGTLRLYRWSLSAFPAVALILPVANLVAQAALPPSDSGSSSGGGGDMAHVLPPTTQALIYALMGAATALRMLSSMSFSCQMLLVNQSAALLSGGAKLGTLNGLAQMSSSVMRAVGPYAASSMFALSVERNLLNGKLVWPILSAVGVLAVVITTRIADLEKRSAEQEDGA